MKKFLAFLSLCLCTVAAMAQTVGYLPVNISNYLVDDATTTGKELYIRASIRNHPLKEFYLYGGTSDTELKMSSLASAEKSQFRLVRVAGATNMYRIYCVTNGKYVARTKTTAGNNATTFTTNGTTEETKWLIVTNNNVAFVGDYDVITGNNTAYVATAQSWNAYGGISDGKAMGNYNADDANSAWEFCRALDKATYSREVFDYTDAYNANGSFYKMTLRGKPVRYNATNQNLEYVSNFPEVLTDDYLFQYVGTPGAGYKVYNRAAGNILTMGSTAIPGNIQCWLKVEPLRR